MKMKKGEDEPEPDFTLYFTLDTLVTANKKLREIEEKYKNMPARKKAKKAECLSRIISANLYRARLPALSPHQMRLAQEVLQQRITGIRRGFTRAQNKEAREEAEALEYERRRRDEIEKSKFPHPNSNQIHGDWSYYFRPDIVESAMKACLERRDFDLSDP